MDNDTRRAREDAVLDALMASALAAEALEISKVPADDLAAGRETVRPLASAFCAMLDAYSRFPPLRERLRVLDDAARASIGAPPCGLVGPDGERLRFPNDGPWVEGLSAAVEASRLNGTAQEAAACDHRWVWHKGEGQWDCAVCGAFGGRDHRRPDTLE